MIKLFLVILNMHEIDKTKFSDQTNFRLYQIKKTENYFINEINQQQQQQQQQQKTIKNWVNMLLFLIT